MTFHNRIVANIDGQFQAAFDRAFNRLARDLDDLSPIFEVVGELYLGWTYDQFFTEGDAGGTPWPDLSEAYLEEKLRENPFALNILQRTNEMHLSFIRRGYTNNVWDINAQEAVFGSLDPKARWHQTGTSRMPARPIIVMNDARRTQLTKAIQAKLLQMIGRTGLGTFAEETRLEGF